MHLPCEGADQLTDDRGGLESRTSPLTHARPPRTIRSSLADRLFRSKDMSKGDKRAVQNCSLPNWRLHGAYSQADFFVEGRNSIRFPRSSGWPSHSHPHWQRMESHNRAFLRSALHNAHDLIHMMLTQLHCADWSKSVSFSVCIGRTEWGNGPEVWGTGHRSNCHHRASWQLPVNIRSVFLVF